MPKKCVFTVRQLTLTFGTDPKLFYGTSIRNLNTLFLPSSVIFYV